MAPKCPLDASTITPTFDQKVIKSQRIIGYDPSSVKAFGKPDTPISFSLPKVYIIQLRDNTAARTFHLSDLNIATISTIAAENNPQNGPRKAPSS